MGYTSGFYRISGGGIANLEVTKSVSDSSPIIGDTVVFTIIATNSGDYNANSVVVTDVLPSGYSFISANPSIGTWTSPDWNIGNLLAGTSASIEIIATVLPTGTYDNTADITGVIENISDNSSTVIVTPSSPPMVTFTASDPYISLYPFTIDEVQLWTVSPLGLVVSNVVPGPFMVVSSQTDVVNIINTFIGPSHIPTTSLVGPDFSYTGTQAFQVSLNSTGFPVATYTFS